MKNKYAIFLCIILAVIFGGGFWMLTSGACPAMLVLRIGFTIALALLGVGIGCFIQILSLCD